MKFSPALQHFFYQILFNLRRGSAPGLLVLAATVLHPGPCQAGYNFSYNWTGGPATRNTTGLYTGVDVAPWVYYSEWNNAANNGQLRFRDAEGFPVIGIDPTGIGSGMRPRATTAHNHTGIYFGNDLNGDPFVMDLSAPGSSFTMTLGWAPNPATSGIKAGGAQVSDVGNLIMKMGMLSAPTGQAHTLGTSPSLFISMREIAAVADGGAVFGYARGYLELRDSNTGAGLGQFENTTRDFAALYSNQEFIYYIFETIYTNAGYDNGKALFDVSLSMQAYRVNRDTQVVNLLGSTIVFAPIEGADTDLTVTDLETMYAAIGYTFTNQALLSITGATFDYFETLAIPEPVAGILIVGTLLLLVTRRRR